MRSLRDSFRSFAKGFEARPLWEYWLAFKNTFWEKFWGPSLIGVIFGLLTLFLAPSKMWFLVYLLIVTFIAGYHMWREEHIRWRELDARLTPKFEVPDKIRYQPAPTINPATGDKWVTVWAQLLPKCLTEAPVEGCLGHLRRVLRWSEKLKAWEETQMNESLPLGWSHDNPSHPPITLEAGNEKRLNVFCVPSTKNVILPAVYPLPFLWEEYVYKAEDTFLFDITVRGRDCPPVDVYLTVKAGEQWDKPIVEFIPKPDASILPA